MMILCFAVTLIYSLWNISQNKYINTMDIIMRDIEQQHSVTFKCKTIVVLVDQIKDNADIGHDTLYFAKIHLTEYL